MSRTKGAANKSRPNSEGEIKDVTIKLRVPAEFINIIKDHNTDGVWYYQGKNISQFIRRATLHYLLTRSRTPQMVERVKDLLDKL